MGHCAFHLCNSGICVIRALGPQRIHTLMGVTERHLVILSSLCPVNKRQEEKWAVINRRQAVGLLFHSGGMEDYVHNSVSALVFLLVLPAQMWMDKGSNFIWETVIRSSHLSQINVYVIPPNKPTEMIAESEQKLEWISRTGRWWVPFKTLTPTPVMSTGVCCTNIPFISLPSWRIANSGGLLFTCA